MSANYFCGQVCHCVGTCVTDDGVCEYVCLLIHTYFEGKRTIVHLFLQSLFLSTILSSSLCLCLAHSSTSCSFHFLFAYAILGHTIDPFRLNKQTSSCCIQILAQSPRLECTLLHPLSSSLSLSLCRQPFHCTPLATLFGPVGHYCNA